MARSAASIKNFEGSKIGHAMIIIIFIHTGGKITIPYKTSKY